MVEPDGEALSPEAEADTVRVTPHIAELRGHAPAPGETERWAAQPAIAPVNHRGAP